MNAENVATAPPVPPFGAPNAEMTSSVKREAEGKKKRKVDETEEERAERKKKRKEKKDKKDKE